MSRNQFRPTTEPQKAIYERFRILSNRHGEREVWSDFIILFACSICLSNRDKHYAEYPLIAKKYTKNKRQQFAEMLDSTIVALERNPGQDFLGDLFMRLGLGNTRKGQLLTLHHACKAYARIFGGNLKKLEKQEWISIFDPCEGAEALLIAFVQECSLQGINYCYI